MTNQLKLYPKGTANIADDRVLVADTFEKYFMIVKIRSAEYMYSDEILFENIEYFLKCYNSGLSAYNALLFLYDYLNGDYDI